MNLLNIISFCLSVVAYTIHELFYHGKLKWIKNDDSFWGDDSWSRKYKDDKETGFVTAPNNFYYRFFKIGYKEKFPGSATIFVSLTDSQHLMQLLFKLFLILTLVTYQPVFNMVWDFIVYFVGFGVVFSLTYKWLSK